MAAVDDTIELHGEYLRLYDYYENTDGTLNYWAGHVAARDVAHYVLTGENEHIAWIDYLIAEGLAESRQNWQDWARPHPHSVYERAIHDFSRSEHSLNSTYFLMSSMAAALRRLRNQTGWIERDGDYGWRLTPSGIAVADALAEDMVEEIGQKSQITFKNTQYNLLELNKGGTL